jgi:hypothetical protein
MFCPAASPVLKLKRRKTKHGGTLHAVVDHRAGHPATEIEHLDSPVVRGDQRAFGGGHRNQELSPGMLAVDLQRTGEADRNLGHAGEVFDVALEPRRIEGVVTQVLELHARVP